MLLRNLTNDSDKAIVLLIEDDEKKWVQENYSDYLVFQFLRTGISFKISNDNLENFYFGNLMEYLIDFLRKMNNFNSIGTITNSHILQCFINDKAITIPRFSDKFTMDTPSIRVRLVLNSSNSECFDTIRMELNAFRHGYTFPPLNIFEIEPHNKSNFGKPYRDGKSYYRYLDNTEANCLLLISDGLTHLVNKWQLINKWYKMIKNSEDNQISDKRFIHHPYLFNVKIKANVMSKVIEKALCRENKTTFYAYDLDDNGSIKHIDDF